MWTLMFRLIHVQCTLAELLSDRLKEVTALHSKELFKEMKKETKYVPN